MSFLIPEIFIQLIIHAVSMFFLSVGFVISIRIIRRWDFSSSSAVQYGLEKQSYLISVLMKYIFIINIPVFLLFIFANDKLSAYLEGAMCAAGIVNATVYGKYLITVKIINLILYAAWLSLNRLDSKSETMAYTPLKSKLIPLIFVSFVSELILFILHFGSIDTTVAVSCCNVIFGDNTSVFKTFSADYSVQIYAAAFILLTLSALSRKLLILSNLLHLAAGISVLTYAVSPYIYELPTHKCPFCILQPEYGFIGYVFYVLIYAGTALGVSAGFISIISGKTPEKTVRYALIFNTAYMLLCLFFPLSYYLRNSTWL